MAKVVGKFVSGVVGPVIFKKVRNRQLVVAKPKAGKIKMTQATYNASYIFGRASKIAYYIRGGTYGIMRFYDSGMISRFTGECNRIVQKATNAAYEVVSADQDYFNPLNGFEFNQSSPVKRYLFAQPQVTLTEQEVIIDFPSMLIPKDLVFIPHASYCTVAFRVSLFDLKTYKYLNQEIQSFEVELQKDSFDFEAQLLKFIGAPGALCIVYISLLYAEKTFAGRAVLNSQDVSPAAILRAAFCPGEALPKEKWKPISFEKKKTRKGLKES